MRKLSFLIVAGLAVVASSCSDDCKCPVKYEYSEIETYPMGILREVWTIASPPIDPATGLSFPTRGLYDPAVYWYNPYTQFKITDIYDREVENQSDNRMHVLVLDYDPSRSHLIDSVSYSDKVWVGIMRGFPKAVWDQSRTNYIQLRMAVRTGSTGILHLDLGRISEDVNGDGIWNTEDQIRGGVRNGILDVDLGEDTGLDGIPDQDEVSWDGTPYDPTTNPDPAGDNWAFDPDDQTDISHINGTEDNSQELLGGYPDSEDIGGINQNYLDFNNDYYSFSIDLANPGDLLVPDSAKVDSDHNLIWNDYHIPLWGVWADALVGIPDSSSGIQYARLWLDQAAGPVEIYIAAMNLVTDNRIDSVEVIP